MLIPCPQAKAVLYAAARLSLSAVLRSIGWPTLLESILRHGPDNEPEMEALLAAVSGRAGTRNHVDQARILADRWRTCGVQVMEWSGAAGLAMPGCLFLHGPPIPADHPLAAVMNSRKPKGIHPDDRWVRVTGDLTRHAVRNGWGLAASLGSAAYELACAVAVDAGAELTAVLPDPLPVMRSPERLETFRSEFGSLLPEGRTRLISPFPPAGLPGLNQRRPLRDAIVARLADHLFMVEISSGGNMEQVAQEALKQGRAVTVFMPERFDRATAGNRHLLEAGASPWKQDGPPAPKGHPRSSRPGTQTGEKPAAESRLIHFTRSCPGPWPGQSRADYYRALTMGLPDAEHSAFDTLCRILEEGRIRASDRMTRGRVPVVSFTARSWSDIRELVRWRPGLIRWTFAPYGLSFSRQALFELGARPAVYADGTDHERLPESERFRFQRHRPPECVWKQEREWRMAGDLDLAGIAPADMEILVPSSEEAGLLADRFGVRAFSVAEGSRGLSY